MKLLLRWFPFVAFVAFVFLAVVAYRGFLTTSGTLGHNWDWPIPESAASLALLRGYFSHAILPLQMGQGNLLALSVAPFYEILGWLGYFGINGEMISKGLIILASIFSAWGVYLLVLRLLNQRSLITHWGALMGGIFYGFSPFLFNEAIGGSVTQIFSYTVVPFLISSYLNYLSSKNLLNRYLIWTTLLSGAVSVSNQYIVLSFGILFLLLLVNLGRDAVLKSLVLMVFFLLCNLYWIAPVLYELLLRNSYIYSSDFFSLENLSRYAPHFSHAIFGLGYLRDFFYMSIPTRLEAIWPLATTTLVLVGMVVPLFISFREKSKKFFLLFAFVYMIALIFVSGQNSPFSFLVEFFYTRIPWLTSFRTPHHYILLTSLCLSCLLGMGLVYTLRVISSSWRLLLMILSLLCLSIWLSPSFRYGDLASSMLKRYQSGGNYLDVYKLSPGYKEVLSILNADTRDGRVFYFPPESSPYYLDTAYQDEAQGGDPILLSSSHSDITRPSKSNPVKEVVSTIESFFINSNDIDAGIDMLRYLNTRYIILRRDIVPAFGPLSGASFTNEVEPKFDLSPQLIIKVDTPEVKLYEIKTPLPQVFITSDFVSFPTEQTLNGRLVTSLLPSVGYESTSGSDSATLAEEVMPAKTSLFTDTLEYHFHLEGSGDYQLKAEDLSGASVDLDYSLLGANNELLRNGSLNTPLILSGLPLGEYLLKVFSPALALPADIPSLKAAGDSNPDVKVGQDYFSINPTGNNLLVAMPFKYVYTNLYNLSFEYSTSISGIRGGIRPDIPHLKIYPPIDDVEFELKSGFDSVEMQYQGQYKAEEANIVFDSSAASSDALGNLQVKNITLQGQLVPRLFIQPVGEGASSVISPQAVQPTFDERRITFNTPPKPYMIVLTTPFDEDWQIDLPNSKHVRVLGFANGWIVDSSAENYGSRETVAKITFKPRGVVQKSIWVSLFGYISLILVILFRSIPGVESRQTL